MVVVVVQNNAPQYYIARRIEICFGGWVGLKVIEIFREGRLKIFHVPSPPPYFLMG